jgi:hypothetical protein
MTGSGTSVTSRKVNSQECAAYRAGASLAAGAVAMAGLASAAAATDETASLPDIRDFVRRLFIHGVPYEESIRYGPNVIPTLLEMLADPREERAWPNIVIVLGMLGDDRALTPLISFIEQNPGGRLDYNRYEAKKNAIFALGYLVNKSGNQQALAYLKPV